MPDEPDLDRIRHDYAGLTLADDNSRSAGAIVGFRQLVAFLAGDFTLTDPQQSFLYSSERLLSEFEYLVADFAADPSDGKKAGSVGEIIHMPMAAAASSEDEAITDRILAGAYLKIRPFGPPTEFLVTVTLRKWATTPGALLIRNARTSRLARIQLRSPGDRLETSGTRDINLRRDLGRPEHARQVELLRDPTTTGVFLK